MRRIALPFILISCILAACSDKGSLTTPVEVQIDGIHVMLRNGFQADSVQIFLDGAIIVGAYALAPDADSNYRVGVAMGISQGTHTLRTTVMNERVSVDTVFNHDSANSFVYIDYARNQRWISYAITTERPSDWPF